MTSFRLNQKLWAEIQAWLMSKPQIRFSFWKNRKLAEKFLQYLAVYLVMVKFYSWGHFVLCNVQLLLCQYVLLASRNPYPIIDNCGQL